MSSARFQQIERLFHAARELPGGQREQYLSEAVADDLDLKDQVLRLLRFDHGAAATVDLVRPTPLTRPSTNGAAARLIGARIGAYEILELLGEGGFGAVYRARQERPVRRQVALKILAAGLASPQVLARFEAEKQALALMDHPNIASVFDAGQTDVPLGSRPYFVMELVSGTSITDYCDLNRLTTHQRLELFMTVCRAVQHAHQKGIIHRDLKPSNILVGTAASSDQGTQGSGEDPALDASMPRCLDAFVKIIDFGIAKAVHQPLVENMLVTEAKQLLGTPQYMSPEQADPDSQGVDTRTDIYSLGVILYELLTGSTPLDAATLRNATFAQLQRMIREQTLERPSNRLTRIGNAAGEIAQRRSADPSTLHRRLKGDLDWITLRALDPDRDRRYASASALADDVRRHLNHEPVLAGPPGAAYRMRKFIRRHRVGTLAASLVALAIVGGAIGTTIGMMRARDSAVQALAVNEFMREVLTSVEPENQGADVRLVEVLEAASQTASLRFANHPLQEAMVRDMLGEIYDHLSMWQQSAAELKRSLALRQAAAGMNDPQTLWTQLGLVIAYTNAGRGGDAEQALGDLLPRMERVLGPHHPRTINCRRVLGVVHLLRGRVDESERTLRQALAMAIAIDLDDEGRIPLLDNLTSALMRQLPDKNSEREPMIDEMRSLTLELIERTERHDGIGAVSTLRARSTFAEFAYENGELAEAAAVCRGLLRDSGQRFGECHAVRTDALIILWRAAERLGEIQEAADCVLSYIACARAHAGPNAVGLVSALSDALPLLDQAWRWDTGESCARELIQALAAMPGSHVGTISAESYLARFQSKLDRYDEAEAVFQSLLSREQSAMSQFERARLNMFYGAHLTRQAQFEEAEGRLQLADSLLDDIDHDNDSKPHDLISEFIALYEAWGKPDRARAYQQLRDEATIAQPPPQAR